MFSLVIVLVLVVVVDLFAPSRSRTTTRTTTKNDGTTTSTRRRGHHDITQKHTWQPLIKCKMHCGLCQSFVIISENMILILDMVLPFPPVKGVGFSQ